MFQLDKFGLIHLPAVVLLRQFVELAHVVLCYLIVTRNVRPRTWIL